MSSSSKVTIISKESTSSNLESKWSRSRDIDMSDNSQYPMHTERDDDWDFRRSRYLKTYDYDEANKRIRENYKKMRCQNIINSGKCSYGSKCLYAHSLADQKVDGMRKIAMDVILKRSDLSDIDISTNKKLYSHLNCMSSICPKCKDGICTGGYNCKHGACDPGYIVCLEDMNKGTCKGGCGKIHLTDRGLIPYGVRIVSTSTDINFGNSIKPVVIDETFFKNIQKLSEENNEELNNDDKSDNNINKMSAMELFLSGNAKKDTNNEIDKSEKIDPILSLINHDYLLEDALEKQDAKKNNLTTIDIDRELSNLNLSRLTDSSSDSLSISSLDDSDDITDVLLLSSDTSKLERSIFGIPVSEFT